MRINSDQQLMGYIIQKLPSLNTQDQAKVQSLLAMATLGSAESGKFLNKALNMLEIELDPQFTSSKFKSIKDCKTKIVLPNIEIE